MSFERRPNILLDSAITEVADDHLTVPQTWVARNVLAVYSELPKESPLTVTDVPPLIAEL